MRRRAALALCLVAAGCGGGSDASRSLVLDITKGSDVPSIAAIHVVVLSRTGVIADAMLPGGGQTAQIPGSVVIDLPEESGDVAAVVTGISENSVLGAAVGYGYTDFAAVGTHEQVHRMVHLTRTFMDGDHDGIPDAIDNCPTVANADQVNTGSTHEGDACRGRQQPDAGVDAEIDAPVDGADAAADVADDAGDAGDDGGDASADAGPEAHDAVVDPVVDAVVDAAFDAAVDPIVDAPIETYCGDRFTEGFEGDLTAWDVMEGTAPTVSSSSPIEGSKSLVVAMGAPSLIGKSLPVAEDHVVVQFKVDLANLTSGMSVPYLMGLATRSASATAYDPVQILFARNGSGTASLVALAATSPSVFYPSGAIALSSDQATIRLDWTAAASGVPGHLKVSVNGTLKWTSPDLYDLAARVEQVNFGTRSSSGSGSVKLDSIVVNDCR